MNLAPRVPAVSIVAIVLLSADSALACFSMPRNLARPHPAVIAEAKQIYWAEVLGSKPTRLGGKARNPVRYTLRVLRTLKGQAGATAEIDGEGDLSGIGDTTFTNHTDDEFWRQSSGRMGVKGDCSMVPPHFIIGKRYLIVISPVRGHETVRTSRYSRRSLATVRGAPIQGSPLILANAPPNQALQAPGR